MSSPLLTGAAIEGRRAVRGLARSPGFSVGVVLVLGIAIAGMVTMATATYELFLKPLPFLRAEQLVETATGLLLALVVFATGLWPAERAARIEPTEALRHE